MQLIFLQKLLTHDWRQRVILKDERHTSSVSFRSNPYFSGLCSWTKWIYQQWCGREWPINFVCENFQYLFTWIVQWIILSLSITCICLIRTARINFWNILAIFGSWTKFNLPMSSVWTSAMISARTNLLLWYTSAKI